MTDIRRVAEVAGVSTATVSRVVNNTGPVNAKTREKVQQAILELDYRPNKLASSLRQKETRIVGILQTDHSTHFSSIFADAAEDTLFNHGFTTIMSNTYGERAMEKEQIEFLLDMRVGGILLRPFKDTSHIPSLIRRLEKANVACVLVESYPVDPLQFHANLNNVQGGHIAIQHLLELGHRSIGMLLPFEPWHTEGPHDLRLAAVQRAIAKFPEPVELHIRRDNAKDQVAFGFEATRALLKTSPGITAIFGTTDLLAAGALHAAQEMNLSVPSDLSIIGYDDSYVASSMHPRLTTVSQPIDALGEATGKLLLSAIEAPTIPPRSISISNILKVRDSSGPARTS
ncbi:LacI family DNA-binding transcriptional regulator [Pseudovibrio ascidiaceicola]|uniref:LacI family DNA-binding transcriptional regulator n=1 Tax=Pseudovibrio ascidiaceicola TaxID=285279 RepID=UPI000D69E720|nr:LacI family DNA-binding transcriptional regulator [Pseudovibrio ascidiaceicola]